MHELFSMASSNPAVIHTFSLFQRKHQAMYDDFVKRKDMKREGYSAGSLHSFTTNGGNTRYTLPISGGGGGGGDGAGGIGAPEGGVGGGCGGGVTKFDRHDPRQVCVKVPSSLELLFFDSYRCSIIYWDILMKLSDRVISLFLSL